MSASSCVLIASLRSVVETIGPTSSRSGKKMSMRSIPFSCAIDSTRYGEFLSTIASHGFLVLSTVPVEGQEGARGTPENMIAAFDWAESENARAGSPLAGKVKGSGPSFMEKLEERWDERRDKGQF